MRTLVTGGYGQLGTELQKHLEGTYFSHDDLDVLDPKAVYEKFMLTGASRILHLAAYTDVGKAEVEKQEAWNLNVVGTQNVVRAAKFVGAKVVYLSTDYVFDGARGAYEPWDAPNPVNYYGLMKLMEEAVVRGMVSSLIVRTSFKAPTFPHPKVVEDLWTSADYVDVIAPMLVDILHFTGIHHLGTERKRLVDLVRQRNPDVGTIQRSDVKSVQLPRDVSFGSRPHLDWEYA